MQCATEKLGFVDGFGEQQQNQNLEVPTTRTRFSVRGHRLMILFISMPTGFGNSVVFQLPSCTVVH